MRPAEERVLDGNAVAGVLAQIFVPDSTRTRVTCSACTSVRDLAAARLYQGAGQVLRCPTCEAVLMRIVVAPGRTYLEVTGVRCLELATA